MLSEGGRETQGERHSEREEKEEKETGKGRQGEMTLSPIRPSIMIIPLIRSRGTKAVSIAYRGKGLVRSS